MELEGLLLSLREFDIPPYPKPGESNPHFLVHSLHLKKFGSSTRLYLDRRGMR
jgi:hypothetical protein